MKQGRPHDPQAAGFVLAGGRSSRMGTDKALIELGGRPLVEHGVELLKRAGLTAAIAGARSELGIYAPVVEDVHADRGPLGGICSALNQSISDWNTFISVDTPFLIPSLLRYVVFHACTSGRAVTLTALNGFPQTFPVVIHRRLHDALEAELREGRLGCFAALRAAAEGTGEKLGVLAVEELAQCGVVGQDSDLSPYWWYLNVNTSRDLALAEECHRAVIA